MVQEKKLSSRVHFLGNRDHVEEIFSILDVFVLPSLWEGLPLALLEAMSMALPIVATDVDGNNEILKNEVNGLLVPARDGSALAHALSKYLNNPPFAKQMGERAELDWRSSFQTEMMLNQTKALYESLYR